MSFAFLLACEATLLYLCITTPKELVYTQLLFVISFFSHVTRYTHGFFISFVHYYTCCCIRA
jgi:hypothetical protein